MNLKERGRRRRRGGSRLGSLICADFERDCLENGFFGGKTLLFKFGERRAEWEGSEGLRGVSGD